MQEKYDPYLISYTNHFCVDLKKMQEINLSSGNRKGSLQQGTKTTTLKKIYKFDYIKIKVLIDKMDEIYT